MKCNRFGIHRKRHTAAAVLALMFTVLLGGLSTQANARRVPANRISELPALRRALLSTRSAHHGTPEAVLRVNDVPPTELVEGQASITFAPQESAVNAKTSIASFGARVVSTIPELNVYQVELPDGWSVQQGIAALTGLHNSLRVEPVVKLAYAFQPNDPLYRSQPYLSLIHAEQAWDLQKGDPNVIVAVVDSGVDMTHPDLQGQIWTNPSPGHMGCGNDLHGCNYVDPHDIDPSCAIQGDAPPPNPDVSPNYFHGTAVAGVLGAVPNNGVGIVGIVPRATLMPVKVGDCKGPHSLALAQGIIYAAKNAAQIINLSIGGDQCDPLPSYDLDAIAFAENAGAIVVAASGNDGLDCVGSPANLAGVIAVGATDATGERRSHTSNWGPEIAVVAPGERIISTTPRQNAPPPNDLYRTSDGTSFAVPMVAGLADLLLSQNALLTTTEVQALVEQGATPLSDAGEPGWAGAGRIDLWRSLTLVPAAFYGVVTVDGAPVPGGTPVEARIAGQVCGNANTFTVQGNASYVVYVPPDAAMRGCGKPGAAVTLLVNGRIAGSRTWSATSIPLDLAPGGASQPTSRVTGTVMFHRGWNLVAGPTGTTFNSAVGPIYTLQPGDSTYESPPGALVQSGLGYWAYFAVEVSVSLTGVGPASASIRPPPGQPILVGNPNPASSVRIFGADQVLAFDSAQNTYVAAQTLQPGQGAWVVSLSGAPVTLR